MKIPLEEHFPYAGLALLVLAIFYVTYFRKMLAQKRKVMYGNLLTFVFSFCDFDTPFADLAGRTVS